MGPGAHDGRPHPHDPHGRIPLDAGCANLSNPCACEHQHVVLFTALPTQLVAAEANKPGQGALWPSQGKHPELSVPQA